MGRSGLPGRNPSRSAGPGNLHQAIYECIVNGAFHQNTGAGETHLSGMPPNGCGASSHRRLQIRIGKHELWAFASELERDSLEPRSCRHLNAPPRFHRSGERDRIDLEVFHQGRTCHRACSMDDIEYAWRNSSLQTQPREQHRRQRCFL